MPLPWLYDHRTNVTSQTGEDGVLEKIFERIGVGSRWCVDLSGPRSAVGRHRRHGLQDLASTRALVDLAREKGYELVAHLVSNCVFVLKEEFPKLEIEDNSLETLFTSPFVPTIVSDLDGVHYLLKEGPWGFSGAVWSNDPKAPDTDLACAVRAIRQLEGRERMEVNVTQQHGHVASIEHDAEAEGILRDFVERMRGYHGV